MFNLAILRHNRLRPVWITCFGIVYRVLSKHVQGSTSFSIVQFSRSCAGRSLADSSFILPQRSSFVKNFFEVFSELSAVPAGPLSLWQLVYFISFQVFCQDLFEIFLNGLSAVLSDPSTHTLSVTVLRGQPEPVQLYYHVELTESSVFCQFLC